MGKDITEKIDDMCRDKYGHTDWVILSTLSDQEKVGLDTVAVIETIEGVQVAFYCEARGEHDE
tara:strand:+ start:958 stop:1146 length:189 start_codon:yes stop_codon:yes gene_type:complete